MHLIYGAVFDLKPLQTAEKAPTIEPTANVCEIAQKLKRDDINQ